MKVTAEQLEELKEAISPFDTKKLRALYKETNFDKVGVHDVDKRYRWDLVWLALPTTRSILSSLYEAGCNDSHIDTALRTIVPPL
jgi:hypothetical protein